MENRGINASLSTKSRTFRPGGEPVSFMVTVINDSDQFAAFQLEVLAAGAERSSGSRWYRLSPEVSAAKPPGSSTEFKIIIFDTPLPAFVGTINLTIRIFSPQLREERKLVARLAIEQGTKRTLLSVDLPVKRFQAYPLNPIDIPVWVRNWGQEPVDVVLCLAGLDPSGLIRSAERRLLVDPGVQVETTIQCQPPGVLQAPSKDYPFIIEASSRNDTPVRTQGVLEVLPVGFIEFIAKPQEQTIPLQRGWLPDWKSDSASFQLLLKNKSNMLQQVNVQLEGKDQRRCTCRVLPEYADLGLGETTEVLLQTRTKRPWVGLAKTLQLEARAALSDARLGSTDPATQTLKLRVLPVVPLWLVLTLLVLLAALLWRQFQPVPIAHTDFVNVVRFSQDGASVVSGSDDCTIRRWRTDSDHSDHHLDSQGIYESEDKKPPLACDGKPPEPKGLLAVADQPVRALKFDPRDASRLAAGMENGGIQLWNVGTSQKEGELKDSTDSTTDRVFDLVFSRSSRYLFSGHASGKVRLWAKQSSNFQFQLDDPKKIKPMAILSLSSKLNYQIRALDSYTQPPQNEWREQILVSAGQYKRLVLWDLWNNQNQRDNPPKLKSSHPKLLSLEKPSGGQGQNDYIWSVTFVPNQPWLLATSDSDGYITIWDLNKCQPPSQIGQPPSQQDEDVHERMEPIEQKCKPRARWQAAATSVRSIVFDSNDDHQLVSAGDDGRVVIWHLKNNYELDRDSKNPEFFISNQKINSIDIKSKKKDKQGTTSVNEGTTIVSGGDDFQVKLFRTNEHLSLNEKIWAVIRNAINFSW